jgi:hypothetical protein
LPHAIAPPPQEASGGGAPAPQPLEAKADLWSYDAAGRRWHEFAQPQAEVGL